MLPDQKIYIEERLSPELQDKTLLHEVLEVLDCELGIGLKHHQIDLLEQGLHSTEAICLKSWRESSKGKRRRKG